MMMTEPTLVQLARTMMGSRGKHSKDYPFYEIYERYFSELRNRRLTILELGVFEGESTKVFSRYFPKASIIAVDNMVRDIDFSDCRNVTCHQSNQTDGDALTQILNEHAPNGLDIIIDDASHVGWFSQLSFYHLFPRLIKGGLYIVEDWGTGYKPDWDDGVPFQRFDVVPVNGQIPRRIPSHDYGMVGFIKWLVDIQGSGDIGGEGAVPVFGRTPFDFMHIYHSTAVIRKWPT